MVRYMHSQNMIRLIVAAAVVRKLLVIWHLWPAGMQVDREMYVCHTATSVQLYWKDALLVGSHLYFFLFCPRFDPSKVTTKRVVHFVARAQQQKRRMNN